MQPPVINLFKSLKQAMYFRNSQINTQFIFSGVHLLPNNPVKYIQATNTTGGIYLEDWTVKVISICGKELGDITDSFKIESKFTNPNGDDQIVWSLENITQDFGFELIYLKITQALGETFYSQPFRITSIDEDKTCQITYKQKKQDPFQSIGITAWFRNEDIKTEITTYFEESTQSTVTASVEQNELEIFRTELISRSVLIQFVKILTLPFVYINSVRCSLYEAPEIPPPTSQENFSYFDFTISPKYNEIYKQPEVSKGDFKSTDFSSNDFLIYT